MNLTLFMQVLPKAGLGWLGVFAVTIIIVAAVGERAGRKIRNFGGRCWL